MSWIVALVFIPVLFTVVVLPLYSALKMGQVTTGFVIRRPLMVAMVVAVGYVVLLIVSRVYWSDAYRWVLYGLGILNFMFAFSLAYWLLLGVLNVAGLSTLIKRPAVFHVYLFAVAATSLFAVWQYQKPVGVEEHIVYSKKLTSPVRLLQLSDVQYGTITKQEMNARFEQAYSLQPDVIVFTGDLIDFEQYEWSDFAVLARSPVPIFFERGNHEFYHDPTRLLTYLEQLAPVRLLLNDRVEHGELEIIGVDYSQREGHLAEQLSKIARDPRLFSILLYHEPKDVEVAAQTGFDLQLYGHTHGGQIWPFTWVVDWMYEYADGLYQLGDTVAYTSDGVALWGPRMRLGSQNEMVMFHLMPEN